MAIMTFEEYMQSDFRGSRTRGKAKSLAEHLGAAAEALGQKEETRALAEELRRYAEAFQAASGGPSSVGRDREKQNKMKEDLKTLDGFGDFLARKDPSGASAYERIMQEMRSQGKAESFKDDLEFVQASLHMEIEVDKLDEEYRKRSAPEAGAEQARTGAEQPKEPVKKDPTAENLSIDELLNKPVELPGPEEDELPEAEVAEFKEVKGDNIRDAFYKWAPDDVGIQMAVDENGKSYQDEEEIKSELEKPGRRLFVFTEDGALPFALENRDGKLFSSTNEISTTNQLAGKNGGPHFQPKRSLKPTDMAEIPSYKAIESTKNHIGDIAGAMNVIKNRIEYTQAEYDTARVWLDPERATGISHKPQFKGFGKKLWYGIVKTVTLGFGDSKAHRDYMRDLKDWEWKKENYPKWLKDKPEEKVKLRNKLEEYRKIKEELSEKKDLLEASYYEGRNSGEKELERYRSQTEVRMEGIADIIKTGKVTQNNIFANTWLAKSACAGKAPDDPEARESLRAYIVSRTIEERLLYETFRDKEFLGAKGALVAMLNDGSALENLNKSGIYHQMMDDWGDKPIDPDAMFQDFTRREAEKRAQMDHPLKKLQAERQSMLDAFGRKPLSMDCMKDIARFNYVNKLIQRAEKELPKDPHEVTKEQSDDYRVALSNMYRESGLKEYMKPEQRKALEQVIKNQKKTAKNRDTAFKGQPELRKYANLDTDRGVYSLDRMADLVNGAAERSMKKTQQQQERSK